MLIMIEKKKKGTLKKSILKPEDIELWAKATHDVQSFGNTRHIAPLPPSHKKPSETKISRGTITLETIIPPSIPLHPSSFQMDRSLRKKFESGEMEIDGKIDLHGLTLAEAHHQFIKFITQKVKSGARFLLVITGKGSGQGKGVIRQNLPHWCDDQHIKQHILSIKTAKPKDGGDGASYILLRRQKN